MGAEETQERRNLQVAKQVIKDVLATLKIQQVVFIDDSFELAIQPEAAIGWFEAALARSPDEARGLLPRVNFNVPDRGWAEDFRDVWPELEQEERTTVIAGLSRILGSYVINDLQFASALRALFPRRTPVHELGPTAWGQQRDRLLADASTENRFLCLFDQDLSQANGYTEQGTLSGVGLLADLVSRYPSDVIICGILTHTLSPEREIDAWHRFATENELDPGRFLPIAKMRLQDPLSFASAVKKTTLNLYCEGLKGQLINLLGIAGSEAADDINKIDVYDFDRMVLQSSLHEGVPEVETLLRLYQIIHQDHLKRTLLSEDNAAKFNAKVQQARQISRIGDQLREDRPDERWSLRHQELIEHQDLVNAFHSPLQTGDLFRLVREDDPGFILLAQPCDLMVRSNGTRGEHGDDKVAVLVPIRRMTYSQYATQKPNISVRGIVRYLYPGVDDVGLIEFGKAHIIRLDVLDLVVLDRDGYCRLHVATEPPQPPQFHQAWLERGGKLRQKYQAMSEEIDRQLGVIEGVEDTQIRAALIRAVMPTVSLSEVGLTIPAYSNQQFDFGIQRVGRLREPWAGQLLKAYTRYLSRDAEGHDFSI